MKGNEYERKLEFYLINKKLIHISCTSGRFYNGTVLEINRERKFLILIDKKLGEVPILFEEILNIEPFVEEKK